MASDKYSPREDEMLLFQDRSGAFAPTSHKGRTIREQEKNQKRMRRVHERSRYDAENHGKNTWKPVWVN